VGSRARRLAPDQVKRGHPKCQAGNLPAFFFVERPDCMMRCNYSPLVA
jgi:hypothetical protein